MNTNRREDLGQLARKVGWEYGQGMSADQLVEFCGLVDEQLKALDNVKGKATALLASIDTVIEDTVSNGLFGHKDSNRHEYASAIYGAADRFERQREELREALNNPVQTTADKS